MRYTVEGGWAQFGPGAILQLSKAQADSRAHNLEPAGKRKGWYQVKNLVQLKPGEEIGLDAKFEKLSGNLKSVLVASGKKNVKELTSSKPAEPGKSNDGDDGDVDESTIVEGAE